MVRKLSLALFLAANIPFGAWALGLGDIHVKSALNQELSADIDLLSVKPGELDSLKVQLAAPELFVRAGVDRPYLLTRLRFKTERRPDGEAVIRVTTDEAIREPFLNFLIEVNWPKGRMVREYTLLLDPPAVLDRRPAPVSPPIARAASPATTQPAQTPAGTRAAAAAVAGGDYGPVRSNETLWAIAERLKSSDATVHQMMIALWRANPQAFVDQNINRLKAGETLRVPSSDVVTAVNHQEALQEFRHQMAAWRTARPAPVAPQEAAPAPVSETIPETPSAPQAETLPEAEGQPEAELRLLTPRPEGEGEAGATEGDTTGEPAVVGEIKEELLLAREANASLRQESEELRSRTSTLEQQLADMQRLLTLTNEQLARLQAGLGQDAPAPALEQEGAAQPAQAQPEPMSPETAEAEAPVGEQPVAAVEAPVEEQAVAETTAPTKAAPELAGTLKQAENFLRSLAEDKEKLPIIGAGAGALLLLLVLLLRRRKTKLPEFVETKQATALADEQGAEQAAKPAGQVGPPSEAGLETSFLTDYTPSGVDTLQDDSGEVDPVAEADVYIAYGRYQQAEELIKQAIDRDPERTALKTKLLEIYFANKDKAAFIALAEALAGAGMGQSDPEAWQQAQAMGYELEPAHELFAGYAGADGGRVAAGSDELADDLDLESMLDDDLKDLDLADLAADFDEELDAGAAAVVTGAPEEDALDLDLDLDFDLDKSMEGGEEIGDALAGTQEAAAEDIGADLDLAAFDEALADTQAKATEQAVEDFDLGESVQSGDTAQERVDALGAESTLEEPALEGLDLSDLEQTLAGGAAEDLAADLPTEEQLQGERSEAELKEADLDFGDFSLDEFMDEETTVSQADFGVGSGADEFDEVSTKLDLARAYLEMGEQDGARSILNEVLAEGSDAQKQEAQQLLGNIA